YLSENTETLFDSFREIYESGHQRENYFVVKTNALNDAYYADEEVFVDLDVTSRRNNLVVPGYTIRDSQAFCAERVNLTVHFYSEDGHHETLPLRFASSYTGTVNLPPGTYSVFSNVSVKYGNESDCVYQDFSHIKTIHVNDTRSSCQYNVSTLNATLGHGSYFTNHLAPKQQMILALDASDSMGSHTIEAIKEDLPYFFDLFTREYKVSFVTFSNDVSILSSFLSDASVLKRRINQIGVGGPTYYGPLIDLLKGYNQTFPVVLISDGKYWDDAHGLLELGHPLYGIQTSSEKSVMNRMRTHRVYSDEYEEVFLEVFRYMTNRSDPLYLALGVNGQSIAVGDPLHVTVYVSSLANGVSFPSTDPCTPAADVTVSINGTRHEALLSPEGVYTVTIPNVNPGIHTIDVSAAVGELVGERRFDIVVQPEDREEYWFLGGILVNLLLISAILLLWIKRD
ncbi:MAG: VWA domain-containing protein, partial [Nanobdellota archaeon]